MLDRLVALNKPGRKLETLIFVLAVALAVFVLIAPVAETVLERVTTPALVGWTRKKKLWFWPLVRLLMFRRTAPVVSVNGWLVGCTPMNPTPAGRLLLRTMPEATLEPRLETETW